MSTAPETIAPQGSEPPEEDPRFRVMRRLVNLLLIVMIAGVLTIVIALLLKLKDASVTTVAGVAADERIIGAESGDGRVTLIIEGPDGRQRVVVLDAINFRPLAEVRDR